MGAIASKVGPEARDLFATVLIASASIPGVFSPTMIKVESGGSTFSEMHVDGQAESAYFAVPQTRPGKFFAGSTFSRESVHNYQ
jgi:hypothetical protein